MAAFGALVSVMHIINEIGHHHSPPISLDQQQVESLTQIVAFLQEFLQGYKSPVADGDEADPLEIRIADAAYATEDVIESHIVNNIQLRRSKETNVIESHIVDKIQLIRSKQTKISRFFNCFQCPKNDEKNKCVNLYQDLQQVIIEMNLIKREAMKIDAEKALVHNDQLQRDVSASVVASLRSSSSTTGKTSFMVGSDDALLEIMDQLTADRLHRQVIPIVGMAGIGKTTLAKTVYSSTLIKERFDICAWHTISQKYNIREILSELLCQATKKTKEQVSERSGDELGSELYKSLFGRRFLIVMDDMWSIDAWDEIQCFFPNNENGSRILVTTRLSQLSSQLNNNYSLQMKFLDDVSSWDLFSKTVFREESCPLELKEIGKEIVANCKGLPLSIVVVGGFLKKMENTQASWESTRKHSSSVVNLENDKHCLKILKLSYDHLPVYLKPCFLYMGVFKEDCAIHVSTLINLWVSEGFLKPMNGKSLERIAEGFLKDLIDRNMILIDELGCTGNIKYCKIHDLLRDLCLRESRKHGFYHDIGQPSRINSQHRVVIPMYTLKGRVHNALQSMSHTRSIICEKKESPPCRNLGLLRIMHAYDNRVDELDVSECVNLRHLVGKIYSVSPFLSSVDLFWNLHTLIVSCSDECNAPVGIWKMSQFRHIEFKKSPLCLPDPPPSDGQDDVVIMENLQILKGLEKLKFGDQVVKRIPNIKKLGIEYDGRRNSNYDFGDCCLSKSSRDRLGLSNIMEPLGHDHDYYCLSNIMRLCKLESLYVCCDDDYRRVDFLLTLTFPLSLKSLNLVMNGDFEWEEMLEKIGSLPHLQKLKLSHGCFGTGSWEVVEGQFPCLKYLKLYSCRGLKHWTTQESSIFPRLEQLRLDLFNELEEIPIEIGNIATLQKIKLFFCSESAVMCAKEIVEEQMEFQGEDLPFHVEVQFWLNNEALRSLAGPNFEVTVYGG